MSLEVKTIPAHEEPVIRGYGESFLSVQAAPTSPRIPAPPPGKDGRKLQVWIRLDTHMVEWIGQDGVTMANLNQLLKDLGGSHLDVLVGNKDKCWEYGLLLRSGWKAFPNGDGAAIREYAKTYQAETGERLTYMGQIDGNPTFEQIHEMLKAIMAGKKYHHENFSCVTVSNELVRQLHTRK